jgi:hypothetical protein
MPKQPKLAGMPGKKPPAPSVKVRASRKCRLSAEQREALELLAGNPQW